MILILSDENDMTTDKVIDWLRYYKKNYIRINSSTKIEIKSITIDSEQTKFSFIANNTYIDSDNISAFWYRRGQFTITNSLDKINFNNNYSISNFLRNEIEFFEKTLYCILGSKRRINNIFDNNINKVEILILAKKYGFKIPKTIIAQNKKELSNFIQCQPNCIIKSIKELPRIKVNQKEYSCGTKMITKDMLTDIGDIILPTLVQEYIPKKYEIRTFFLDNKSYSMAIFSQNDPKTIVDYRNYNFDKMNRMVPYKLPEEIEQKLFNIAKDSNINCGSADIIFSTDNKYILLEINPVGQLMSSVLCNYNLEYIIAKYLINYI